MQRCTVIEHRPIGIHAIEIVLVKEIQQEGAIYSFIFFSLQVRLLFIFYYSTIAENQRTFLSACLI